MAAQHQKKISISVRPQPDDFTRLLSANRSYAEIGIAGWLRDDLIASLERLIREQVGDALVAVRINLDSLGTITVRDTLAHGGIQVPAFEIQLDTISNVVVGHFRLEPPVRAGYQGYKGWTPADPHIRRRKSMATRERHFVKLQGLFLPDKLLPFRNEDVVSCECPLFLLTPDDSPPLSENSPYFLVPGIPAPPHMRIKRQGYIVWACNCCGKQYTCGCFRGVMERVSEPGWQRSIPNYLFEKRIGLGSASPTERGLILRGGAIERMARKDRQSVQYREGICHFCRTIPSTITYRRYADTVIKHYLPYILAQAIRSGIDTREAENRVRDSLGVPQIGEGWVSETQLYNLVRMLFPDQRVEREASPQWLGGMRFDIFLPEVGVAIEYQGEQHYRPIERFAGEKGFERTRERDRLKRQRAKEVGVTVVEFKYDEVLTDEVVRKRIARAIKR